MALTPEQIAGIYAKKAAPASTRASTGGVRKRRLSRISTQYSRLPPNNLVRYLPGEHSKKCTSYGCGCPTYMMLRGSPLCQMHMVFALVHEMNLLSHNGQIKTSGVGPHAQGTAPAPLVSALVTSDSGEEDDSNTYL